MTSLIDLQSFDDVNTVNSHYINAGFNGKSRQRRRALKFKENACKHKCDKLLKRKLKKYKLRRDGSEDQDILDVSSTLVSSLVIKSPNNNNRELFTLEGELNNCEELRPKNYLFKMVRKKTASKIQSNMKIDNLDTKQNEADKMAEPISIHDKKHTNAFQLLMDSRNKSIGGNSPGKEKNNEQSDSEEVQEKKITKLKRNLLLQKMAEGKGYLKNKEKEEYQDKIIKIKMDKRAERLKNMIKKESKSDNKVNYNQIVNQSTKIEIKNDNGLKKQKKTFKIVDIFNTLNDPVSPEKKHISEDDKEFLKKLSPSLKKKESMLSYFKKLDKESEPFPIDSENDNQIKVKLRTKKKKRKLSLKKNNIIDENNEMTTDLKTENVSLITTECVSVRNESSVGKSPLERQKRKRNAQLEKIKEHDDNTLNDGQRPKRTIKRPVKYTEEVGLSSSDEELHIFTPKKKKHLDNTSKDTLKSNINIKEAFPEPVKAKVEKKTIQKANVLKKPVKLAPIFATKQLNAEALEAKQKFLQSGVPDKLKKIIQQHKINNIQSMDFPVVVHVQQECIALQNTNKLLHNFLITCDDDIINNPVEYDKDAFKRLLNLNKPSYINKIITEKRGSQIIMQAIKQSHPKFPVYRTFRYLKNKGKGEIRDCNLNFDNSIEIMDDIVDVTIDSPDRLNWTDKYKAMSTNQIIGNFESIKELRKWLISWTENEMNTKSRNNCGSDSSDYYQSDTDSRDSFKSMNNLIILTGPTGCGKTSSVYAVAAELAMKVIEVNASSKRTGKIMLQDLQEATQSHKVNRGTSTDNSQKSVEKNLSQVLKKGKKKGRPKKDIGKTKILNKPEVLSSTPLSQESTRTDMSLILIDDADIVFDQDDGFSSAIVQLVQSSKRPVILITSSLACPHLQRFQQQGTILKMSPLLPRLLGTWLDIMCLADTGISWPGVGAKFLNYFKGDIRKTINYLQLYTSIYAHGINCDSETASQNVDFYKSNFDDENSSMSWADNEDSQGRKLTTILKNNDIEENTMWTNFVDQHLVFSEFKYPIDLFDIWWSVPHLLSITPNGNETQMTNKSASVNKEQDVRKLEAIANAMDSISLSDHIIQCHKNTVDITAQPWYSPEYDSVSEQDNIDDYMNKYEVGHEICHAMVAGSIVDAQDILHCDRRVDIGFPGMSLQRERDKIVSRHKSLTSHLNPWTVLDRRSLALDYWPSCRTICRAEKVRSDGNISTKRNNRFSHYLKSLSVLCKSDTLDNLCDSLSNERTEPSRYT